LRGVARPQQFSGSVVPFFIVGRPPSVTTFGP
jgi:hypothetical protein